ncbi:hypothetical protein F5146DRAFT_1131014 [Armillaria mellea]|nr:hypothetical protein F5146DRAFT_1131014 [Armillaria mellea]
MAVLAFLFLRLIHALYSIAVFVSSCWKRFNFIPPLPLTATRRRIPKHLAVIFVPDRDIHPDITHACLLESVYRTIDWCRELDIEKVTLYDSEGLLQASATTIHHHLAQPFETTMEHEYPPTPPLSEPDSRPVSPEHVPEVNPYTVISLPRGEPKDGRRRHTTARNSHGPMTVYLISSSSSKQAIAAAARSICKLELSHSKVSTDKFKLSVAELGQRLEGKDGLPPPDFMIVHPMSPSKYNRTPLELHGFPPWQTRLTEIYHNRHIKRHAAWITWILPQRFYSARWPVPLTEMEFREALDEFAGAEMRFGKTWQDGVLTQDRLLYTNTLRLARTITNEDTRSDPPIQQIVFYQSGIGSERNLYDEYVDATTGGSLADKVEEAYAFIALNYFPGDEIFLFGFSRGAYTARMVTMFIGAIGLLDRRDMDNFARIFLAYQRLAKKRQLLTDELRAFTKPEAHGLQRVNTPFSIKCVGVFETVGSLGLPDELTLDLKKATLIFGFPDKALGGHIERAYHALALNETRRDFDCAKYERAHEGLNRGQILKQCWFGGCHSDIGGGYRDHDLADIALIWMAANVQDMLSLDMEYLRSVPSPIAPWGLASLFFATERKLPLCMDNITNETIHSSVLEQAELPSALVDAVAAGHTVVEDLLPLEVEFKTKWIVEREPQDVSLTLARKHFLLDYCIIAWVLRIVSLLRLP